MFLNALSAILATLTPERAPLYRVPSARAAKAETDAINAINRVHRSMPLSRRMEEPEEYARVQRERRHDLEALLFRGDKPAMRTAMDLICEIAEETSWALSPAEAFEDEFHPTIDTQAAQTAALFGWVARALGDRLDEISPRIRSRLLYETRKRIFAPVLAHDDYAFLRGEAPGSVDILCSIITAAILLEPDVSKRAAILKRLFKYLDACLDSAPPAPVAFRLADACAVADLGQLIKRATLGVVDKTQELPDEQWLDEILFSHVTDGWFLNFFGGSAQPALSGQAIFRLGRVCGDRALMALGAALHRHNSLPSPSVTGRLFDFAHWEALQAELSPVPRLKHAAMDDGRILQARGAGFFCALTTGGNSRNVGDLTLYLDNVPVLLPEKGYCSIPTISGMAQLSAPTAAPQPDWEFTDERAIMGVDVSRAYPPETGVRAHQRTLMLAREEYSAQLVDVFDFDAAKDVCFRFVTPMEPQRVESGAKLGPALFLWEGDPEVTVRALGSNPVFSQGLWEIHLLYAQAAARSMYTFFFKHA